MGMKWLGNRRSLGLSISITAADSGALSSMAEPKHCIAFFFGRGSLSFWGKIA